MTSQHPTFRQQIEAVEWAERHVEEMGKRARLRASEIEEMRRRLDAARETLRHWEFAQETLR